LSEPQKYRSFFDVPPETKWNLISLGGGVQSSAMALMAAKGLIGPMPDAAIFADTQAEPKAVYGWMEWLKKQLPFPVHTVTAGSLEESEMTIRLSTKSGKKSRKCKIPAFCKNPDGSKGILGRKCTRDFKIQPIIVKAREICGIKRGQKTLAVTQWIGISYDEMGRAKASREPWSQTRFPLLERSITRDGCLEWMRDNGYPEPPRSACLFCPFHSDHEWQRIKDEDPEGWKYVVDFEKRLQETTTRCETLRSSPFLHPSLIPIDQVVFKPKKPAAGDKQVTMHEMWNEMKNECDGMCGI
jgi:hypothetical protein